MPAVLPAGPAGDARRLPGAGCHRAASCKGIRGGCEMQQVWGGCSAEVAKVTFPEGKKSLLSPPYDKFNKTPGS